MKLVGTALGDGIHHAAACLTQFCFESGAGDLEFANHVLAKLIGDAGASDLLRKESVVVIPAVDGVVVEVSGRRR